MQQSRLNRRLVLIVLLIIVVAGAASLVVYLAAANPAYIPLAAALISGSATVLGVGVGALVLRFNYRSQANPLRLELYRKRMESLVALYEKLVIIRFLHLSLVELGPKKLAYSERLITDMEEKIREFKAMRCKYDLIVPQEILAATTGVCTCALAHARYLVERFPEGNTYDPRTPRRDNDLSNSYLASSWNQFVNLSRKYIGVKELSEGILELLGSDAASTSGSKVK